MILIDTSLYIEAAEKNEVRKLLEDIAKRDFVLSCEPIEREINKASDFLRSTGRHADSEKLGIIYTGIKQGVIDLTDRIRDLTKQYGKAADHLSRDQHKKMGNDLRIVASASVAGVKTILSLNRKTMASGRMVEIYEKVNKENGYKTPAFIVKVEDLGKLLQP